MFEVISIIRGASSCPCPCSLGLDSTTALVVITALKKLVENKEATVISSIHQPSSKIFELLENVILVSHGSIAYLGSGAGALKYFSSLGHPLPFQTNPADHLIDVLSNAVVKVDDAGLVHSSVPFLPISVGKNLGADRPLPPPRVETNWAIQFGIIFLRSLQQGWRKRVVVVSNLVAVVIIAIFAAYGPWNSLGNSTANLGKRPAVLFFSVCRPCHATPCPYDHSSCCCCFFLPCLLLLQ